jgi:hypothetical protein
MRKLILCLTLLSLVVPSYGDLRGRYSADIGFRGIDNKANTLVVLPGDDLAAKYAELVAAGNMGTLSATNRRTLILMPGVYTLTSNLTLVQYVDLYAFSPGTATVIYDVADTTGTIRSVATAGMSADETGTTNIITGLRILGGKASFTLATNTYTQVYDFRDCYMWGSTDNIMNVYGQTAKATVNCYNCDFDADYDNITAHSDSTTINLFGCRMVAYADNTLGYNASYVARNIVVRGQNSTVNAYACRMIAISDQTSITNAGARSHNVHVYKYSTSKAYIYGCSLTSTAVKNGSGVAYSEVARCGNDYTFTTDGNITLVSCQIAVTGGYDLARYAGTLTVIGCIYNTSNIYGVMTYSGLVAPIKACTTATSVSAGESGLTFTNNGDSDALVFTLPAATVGLGPYTFCDVVDTATCDIAVTPVGTDTITNTAGLAGAAAEARVSENDTYGSLTIECLVAGKWFVTKEIGTWAEDTAP